MFDDNATSDTLLKFAVNVEGKLVAVVTTPSGDHDNGEEEFERSCDGTDPNDATTEEISVDAMLKVLLSRFAFASRDVHLDVQPRSAPSTKSKTLFWNAILSCFFE